jgi:hypothetical protein
MIWNFRATKPRQTRRPTLRHGPRLFALLASTCVFGLANTPVASAASDPYCAPCYLPGYDSEVVDGNNLDMTGSYAHDLTYSNEWIGAGDANYNVFHYGAGEVFVTYCGCGFLHGAMKSHVKHPSNANAHIDYTP